MFVQYINSSMKPEMYSCLKMLETFNKECTDALEDRNYQSSIGLLVQFDAIRDILLKNINPDQYEFIPDIAQSPRVTVEGKLGLLQELKTASGIAISYLRSLEGSLDRELREKEMELKSREEMIEYQKKIINKTLEAIKEFPEFMRSRVVEETKKSHREIEKHSKKV